MEKLSTWYGRNKRAVWISAAVLVLVVIIVVILVRSNSGGSSFAGNAAPADDTATALVPQTAYIPTNISSKATVSVVAPSAVTLSYTEALAQYRNTRIQFAADTCAAMPAQSVFKNGTKVMLDNRGTARTFAIGDKTFTIGAYGFDIVTVSADTFPAEVDIDCGAQQNVAAILVEK